MEHLNHLKIPLQAIKNCTQDFNETNFLGKGGYGRVYKGILSWADHENLSVAVKRRGDTELQGKKEFYTEVVMLSQYRHENIISLVGFCDDSNEMILVYEYASRGSLDTYLRDDAMLGELSWPKRLNICIGAASALDYLHNHVAAEHRIIHRDIKSANILLDENWNAKLSDFGLSRIGLANQQDTFLITQVAGTRGYWDPQYERTGILTKESDVYSFGVVLFEVLCGRLVCVPKYHDKRRFLHHWAPTCYENGELVEIIDDNIRKHIAPGTLSEFSAIACQCLQETREERPTIAEVALELKKAREIQWDFNLWSTDPALQMSFRSFLFRRAQRLRALSELSDAKLKLEELETLFNDGTYRSHIANDVDERQRYAEKIIALLLAIASIEVTHMFIEGSDVSARASKRSMVDKLEDMLDVVDSRLQ